MAIGRAGEGALLVPEQDRLDKVVGYGATIDRDEWLCPPVAGAVNGACDQLLADTRLALDQYRNGGADGFLGGADDRVHAGAARDDVAKRERARAAALDAVELARERACRKRVAQAHLQPLGANRLDHEIGRARP